jgi:gliding motility-associated-like protein
LTIQAVNEANGLVLQCAISGCGSTLLSDTAKINILENDPVYIPNAFTPDEDQVNPEFKIYTAGNPKFTAMIYNRWGELLFEWKDKALGWDGSYLNTPVADGVYVYRVQVETACESRTYMGTLSLFR